MEQEFGFQHPGISQKIFLAIGIGLLVGLEREFASKDVGVRTFSLTSLLGLICELVGSQFAVAGFVGVLFLTVYMNARNMLVNRTLEITTSVAMLVTFSLGVLIADQHVFTPVAISILMTMLLAWKNELAAFAHGLKVQEIRSAVVLGLLTFVIYPVLPDRFVDRWDLLNPKEAWITVIALAGISFVNYILLKAYSTKGLYYSALLGGAVNSSAAVTEISEAIKLPEGGILFGAMPILLMTTVAMFIRNLLVLGIFEPHSFSTALAPLSGMACASIILIWRANRIRDRGLLPVGPLKVNSPVSVRRILKLAVLFVVIEAAGTLGQRFLGTLGVLVVSAVGGLVSSAGTTAAAAKLASQGKITPTMAGLATVVASVTSAFVNLPLVYQFTRDKVLTRNLAFNTVACILTGLALMACMAWIRNFI